MCLLARVQNGINVLQAAAYATQAALNNPALQPILMSGAHPWLSPAMYQGLSNPAAAALANAHLGGVSPHQGAGVGLDAAALSAAAAQYSASLGQQQGQVGGHAAASMANGGGAMNLNAAAALSLLQQHQHAAALHQAQQQAQQQAQGMGAGPDNGWQMDSGAASSPLQLFYQAQAQQASGLGDQRYVMMRCGMNYLLGRGTCRRAGPPAARMQPVH